MSAGDSTVSMIWAVHQKGNKDRSAWRGVLVGHYNKLDLFKAKKLDQKPMTTFLGWVYDPVTNKDIVLNEIEGRLLEANLVSQTFKPLPKWKSMDGKDRTEGSKMTIMIDNVARDGGRPEYSKGQLAYHVGLSTWLLEPNDPKVVKNQGSPMLMRPIWRDNTVPLWGGWKDPDGIDCELLPMYFISEHGVANLTQKRNHYKFNTEPVKQFLDFGVTGGGGQMSMIEEQAADPGMGLTEEQQAMLEPEEPKEIDSDLFDGAKLEEILKEMDAPVEGESDNVDEAFTDPEQTGEVLEY